jgi:hypothetical protein
MRSLSQVRVGLNHIGLVGLEQALEKADASGSEDRDEIVSLMMEALAEGNYIPSASTDAYRQALWREYLRHGGEDIRHPYSEIEMVVRSRPGPELDRFLETLEQVFAEHELKPVIALEPPSEQGPNPQLRIGDEVVTAGTTDPQRVAQSVGRQISHW